MKRTFLTILPVAAVILLTTSCSKDSDDSNSIATDINEQPTAVATEQTAQPVEETNGKYVAVSFSVTVDNGTSLSKISYSPVDGIQTKVTRAFVKSDNGTELTVVSQTSGETAAIEDGTKLILTLTDDINFTFEGIINVLQDSVANFNAGKITLTGTFGTALAKTVFNSTSLADLMSKCDHQYKATFYSNATDISFVDQNAYLAIQMSPLQYRLLINGTERDLNAAGQVWVALPANTAVSTNFLTKDASVVKPGHVYPIDRTGFVDLGISDGTLWADANVTGVNSDGEGASSDNVWFYTFDQAQKLGVTLPTGGKDDNNDFTKLNNECHWVWNGNGYNVFKKKSGESPSYSTESDPHIFLPAAGCCNDNNYVSAYANNGYYWSCTEYKSKEGYRLYFTSSGIYPESSNSRDYQCSVRAVRHKK